MHPVIKKTFGGLSSQYYFRHFIFGLLFPAFIYFTASQSPYPTSLSMIVLFVVNTLLYPYSRFVYESVIRFIMGQNVFIVNIVLMMVVKITTMFICWMLAVLIAPVGLAYLYFHHSKVGS